MMRAVIARTVLAAALCAILVAADFNMTTAIRGVYYSKVSYCPAYNISAWTCDACPKFPQMSNVSAYIDPDHDSQGWVGYNAGMNEIVLGFRGTVNLQGWVVDGDFFQTNYTSHNADCVNCYVHEGLYWGYQRLSVQLWPDLQRLATAYPDADIFVAGHSMGAGMAGFAFPDVVRTIISGGKKYLYNYGSPRLGNQPFVAWLETVTEPHHEHFRSTNFGDPVVHLAPLFFDELGLGQWLHEPREVFFMNPFQPPETDYRICAGNTTSEDPTCADSTPIWDLLSFVNHTTYLNIGLGCFLEEGRYGL
jgi:hypothetical protein